MNQNEIMIKLNGLRGNLQHLWEHFSENDFEKARQKINESKEKVKKLLHPEDEDRAMNAERHDVDNYVDDLPLTLNRDPSPGVKFYSTENAEIARNAEKVDAHGIDNFGDEKREFDFEEADDFQTNRDRKQNSDLSQRFYTGGLDIDNLNKH